MAAVAFEREIEMVAVGSPLGDVHTVDLGDGGRGTVVAMFSESESPVVSVQYEDQVGPAPPMCIDR